MGRLRIEEVGAPATPERVAPATEAAAEEWRTVALQTGQRLRAATDQLEVLRRTTDELRERERKARGRADSANARADALQTRLVAVMADCDALRARVKSQDELKRLVWDVVKGSQHALERLLAEL